MKHGHFLVALFAWLLWYHPVEYRYPLPVQKDEKGLTKGYHKFHDSWSLEDAFESKKECVDALPRAIKKQKELTQWIEQDDKRKSVLRDIPKTSAIYVELFILREYPADEGGGNFGSSTRLKYWCLPSGTDPRLIGDRD